MSIRYALFLTFILSASCSTVYYKSWELLGQEKRDLLKSNLSSLKDDQEDAKEEYVDALERIQTNYDYKTTKTDTVYSNMKSDYEDLEDETNNVTERINKVEKIAKDLFSEWRGEASAFKNASFKRKSLTKLRKTKAIFNKSLISSRRSESKMKKFLAVFNEQVLFVKHNLNAKAVGSLDKELFKSKKEMKSVIQSLKASISSSKTIIDNLE